MNNLRKILERMRTAAESVEQTQHRNIAGHIGPAHIERLNREKSNEMNNIFPE